MPCSAVNDQGVDHDYDRGDHAYGERCPGGDQTGLSRDGGKQDYEELAERHNGIDHAALWRPRLSSASVCSPPAFVSICRQPIAFGGIIGGMI